MLQPSQFWYMSRPHDLCSTQQDERPTGHRHREPKEEWRWVLRARMMVKCRGQAQLTERCPRAQRAVELHGGCPGTSAGTEEPWACVTCVGSFTPVLQAWRVCRRHSWQRADAFLFLSVPHCPKNPRHWPQAEWGCALWQQDGTHTSGCCFPLSWLILHPRAWMQLLAWGRSPAPHCITSETGMMLGGRAGLSGGGDSCITAGKAKTQHLFGFFNEWYKLMQGTDLQATQVGRLQSTAASHWYFLPSFYWVPWITLGLLVLVRGLQKVKPHGSPLLYCKLIQPVS